MGQGIQTGGVMGLGAEMLEEGNIKIGDSRYILMQAGLMQAGLMPVQLIQGQVDGEQECRFQRVGILEQALFQMQPPIREKKSPKHMTTEKGSTIRYYENTRNKRDYANRRVITETSEKGITEQIKKVKKQFKLPFKSMSPKMKMSTQLHKSSSGLKKPSKMKSPNKTKGLADPGIKGAPETGLRGLGETGFKGFTETGPSIKRKNIKEKNHIFMDFREERKKGSAKNAKSPGKNLKPSKSGKSKKKFHQSSYEFNHNFKTEGSFDSTSSCMFFNEVEVIGLIGQGTFGQVFKGRLKQTGEIVAIKRVMQDKKYKNREIQMVSLLSNQFVMKVLGTYITFEDSKEYLNIIMTHYDCDLFNYIKQYDKKGLSAFDIKLISYQVFRGLLYIHSKGICHRDIKPHNILLKGKNAAICDFGSAKILRQGESNLPYICSRCYRAPELIFGATHYTTMIDIWSMGCVILEMLNKVPLFIGESSIDHLIEVIKVMGTPTKTQVVDMNPEYDLNDYKFPKVKRKEWAKIFPRADPLLIDLLEQIMLYSPKQRLTAAEALAHEYFDEIREESLYERLVKSTGVEGFFDLSEEQLCGNEHLIPKLIPDWYSV